MHTAASLLLLVSLAGMPPAALLAGDAVASCDHDTTWSHEAQPPLVHAQVSPRLPSPRDFTLRDARCHVASPGSRLIGSLLLLADGSSHAHRPDPILRM
jgi:hypothetical protein